jgi:hypothetical protein
MMELVVSPWGKAAAGEKKLSHPIQINIERGI